MITTSSTLSTEQAERILTLAEAASRVDGDLALDEAARLALRAQPASSGCTHLLAAAAEAGTGPDGLAGYASVLPDGTVQGVVDPAERGRGIGSALLQAAQEAARSAGVQPAVWVHGDLPDSLGFLMRRGFGPARSLLVMTAPITAPAPGEQAAGEQAAGGSVTIRRFDSSPRDLDQLQQVNARAFAEHPEQGQLTRDDLRQRMDEDWFQPEDLFVAEDPNGRMLGFAWLKRAGGTSELYVLGVDPDAQGSGLGAALLTRALAHLAELGEVAVELYVDGDNTAAVRLYEKQGFAVTAHHTQLRPVEHPGGVGLQNRAEPGAESAAWDSETDARAGDAG